MVTYLHLAYNERHPVTGMFTKVVIHSFGLGRAGGPQGAGPPGLLDLAVPHPGGGHGRRGRRAGAGARLAPAGWRGGAGPDLGSGGIGPAIRRVATGRRLDGDVMDRVLVALVAQRALELSSQPTATRWAAERVAIEGCPGFSDDA